MKKTSFYLDCACSLFTDPDSFMVVEEEEWKGISNDVCLWPRLHQDIKDSLSKGTYRDMPLGMVREEEWRTRSGTRTNLQWLNVDVQTLVKKVVSRGEDLVDFLDKGLKEKVYDDKEVVYIEHSRKILNIAGHAKKVNEHGAVRISGLQFQTFRAAAVFFEPELDNRVDPSDLRLQWRSYNKVLEKMGEQKMGEQNNNHTMTSLDYLKKLVDPKNKLCRCNINK
jgi:hypothetical protein